MQKENDEVDSSAMRILMLCYEFPPLGGGGSRFAYGLSSELARLGHEVDFVTMGYRRLPRREVAGGVTVHRVRGVRRKRFHCTMPEAATYLVACLPTVRRLLARRRYDIAHAHFILPDGFTAWGIRRIAGLPYVVTAHGSDVPGYNPHRFRAAHTVLGPIWRAVAHQADRIVCPSHHLQNLIGRRLGDLETTVIPHGFDPGRYNGDRARQKRILAVTRLVERKGVHHLLEAVDGLDLEHEIHVVGDGPYGPTLRRIAEGCRARVKFHGWLENGSPELDRLYETSDIFVLASEAENFPISLLEAMAAGLAIVTTRGTGCEEVVGDAGVLVEPGDVDGLRSALAGLTSDPDQCRRLGRAARERLAQRYAWPIVADRYVEVYRRYAN